MSMLYPDQFWAIHGFGAKVYDATGRQLKHVMACNPETGEVIRYAEAAWSPLTWIRWQLRRIRPRLRWDWIYGGELLTRHGFWPAPFRIEPPQPESSAMDSAP